ncbi:MAG: class II aldolase/adducin family protein, partial [Chloroflexi bacterium]|nr:class II aldolase/adducin family protein [Chloroflexota bacterium]
MNSIWKEQKRAVVLAAQKMESLGLVTGTAGNVSVRLPPLDDGRAILAVTPTSRAYDTLIDDDIVVVDHDVDTIEGALAPSSETLLHVGIYKARPDVQAVIHTHSLFSSVAAVAGLDIPPILDEMMVYIGGTVKLADYGFPGTEELADKVCEALGERNAALIRNHGMVGVGRDLGQALDICALVERAAQIFIYASMLGKATTPPPDALEAEL